jgi:tripartite-type tricarboxylate transporter receptor subunit TctC
MKKLVARSLALLLWGTLCAASALAQEYPNKPVRIIVPFGAGGGTDTMARLVGIGLQNALGQPFVIDNKPGASGNIGMEMAAKAPNDGYTLLMITNNIAINPSLYEKVNYHPVKDFVPIVLVGSSPVAISVNTSLGINNMAELLKYAKANSGKFSFATCASGSPQHLAAELLMQTAKFEMTHVPYKGCAPALPDHLSGLVPVSFSTVANLGPHLKGGKIKALAVTGARRSSFAPDLPTVAEAANLPGYDLDVWFGLFAPAGTPRAVINRVNEIVNKTLASAEVRQKMTDQNYDVLGGTPQQLADAVARDIPRYEKVIRSANIKAD